MSEIRIRFIRGEAVKYISHLDLMTVFERALRRARIPVQYSQGFNPHPGMVFGLPLSVGVTSETEYADFKLQNEMNPEEFKNRLNADLPEGLKVTDAKAKKNTANIMADVAMASYDVLIAARQKLDPGEIENYVNEFIKQPEIIVLKEGKNGSKKIDIKPMILELESKPIHQAGSWVKEYAGSLAGVGGLSFDPGNIFSLSMKLSAGSSANLKPELLSAGFREFTGTDMKQVKIHRTGLYVKKKGIITDPLADQALIEI
ncbi:MAG: TIGR03936 family radical SAM-associated protein [Bacillota bacterium]|nr:TIGR03936 family radical SAM-associated protein [Bacillota bacterium]